MIGAWLGQFWPALRSRNLRLYVAAQSISQTGTFVQQVAIGWLVYRLTHSAFALGLVGFLTDLPGAVVVLLAGVALDRIPPYRIVLATQTTAMLQALILAALVWSNQIDIGIILVLAVLLGLAGGFDVPARQVLVPQLIDDEADLPNAVALNSLAYDLARLFGPPLAGILVAAVGEGFCFLLNGTSYLAVIAALMALPKGRHFKPAIRTPAVGMLIEGISYVCSTAEIRAVLILVAAVAFAAAPYATLLPLLAAGLSQNGPHAMGILLGAMAAGSLAGAFFVGQRRNALALGRLVMVGGALFGLCLVLLALSASLILASAAALVAGSGVTVFMSACNALLIMVSNADQRGRVMSLFTLAYMGTVPIGALTAGLIAARIGAPMTLGVGGTLCVLAAAAFGAHLSRRG